jgi:hypothetical protein
MKRTRLIAWLVVLGLCANGIHSQAPQSVLVWEESLNGGRADPLRWPVAVAASSETEFAVADGYGGRLVVFRNDTESVSWNVAASVELPAQPYGVTHDGSRYVVSLRRMSALVALEGAQYRLRRIPLPDSVTPGALATATGGRILLHDLTGERVLLLEGDGELAGEFEVPGHLTGMAATSGGGLVAAFAQDAEVRRYGANGDLLSSWKVPGVAPIPAWPSGVVSMSTGEILVSDRHGDRLVVMRGSGELVGTGSRRGWEPGLLRFPTGLALLSDHRLVVADQGNGRVQIFRRLPSGSN